VNLEAVVIKTSSSTSRVSWIVAAILVGGAAVPGRLSSQDNAFTNRATTLLQTFQARINDITDDALKVRLKEEITSVTAEAGRLDRLDERIHELKNVIDDLEMQYNNARANAEALQSSFASDRENANTKLNSILKEAQTICSSLGGGWVDETNCMFSCPADNPGPCEAKIAQYNQQAAPLNSTMRKIHEDLNSEQERAEHAAAVASEKQHDWEEKKSELAALERNFATEKAEFERIATNIDDDLRSAHLEPISIRKGPAWNDLPIVHNSQKCYDTGCGPVPELATSAIPDAVANSPVYRDAAEPLKKALRNAVEHAQSVRARLRDAEHNPHVSAQELQRRFQDDARAQQKVWALTSSIRILFPTDLLRGIAPKRAPISPSPERP